MWDKVGTGSSSWPAAKSDPSTSESSIQNSLYPHQPQYAMPAPISGYMGMAPSAVGAQ